MINIHLSLPRGRNNQLAQTFTQEIRIQIRRYDEFPSFPRDKRHSIDLLEISRSPMRSVISKRV